LPTFSSVAARPSSVCRSIISTIASRPSKPSVERLGHAATRERDDANSVRAEFDGELPLDRLDHVEGDRVPQHPGQWAVAGSNPGLCL
jgi:hypothetical protein